MLNIACMHFVYDYSHYFFKSEVHCNLLNTRCTKLLAAVPAAYNYNCNYAKIYCVYGQLFIFCAVYIVMVHSSSTMLPINPHMSK